MDLTLDESDDEQDPYSRDTREPEESADMPEDFKTGELEFLEEMSHIVTNYQPEFSVTDEASADWVGNKVSGYHDERARRKKAYEIKDRELLRKIEYFNMRFGAEMRDYAISQLQGQRSRKPKKSLKLPCGAQIGFKAQPRKLDIYDNSKLTVWAEEVSGQYGIIKGYDAVIDLKAADAYALTTGEVLPGVKVTEADPIGKFYIK